MIESVKGALPYTFKEWLAQQHVRKSCRCSIEQDGRGGVNDSVAAKTRTPQCGLGAPGTLQQTSRKSFRHAATSRLGVNSGARALHALAREARKPASTSARLSTWARALASPTG